MIACLDVDYRDNIAVAACVTCDDWRATVGNDEFIELVSPLAPYCPGQFYQRELPCLLKVLGKLPALPTVAIIDGFVWLGDFDKPGLGAYLFRAFEGRMSVVGVAKNWFRGAAPTRELLRGKSTKPLFISSVGIDLTEATAAIGQMAGEFRIPTLLRRVDQLARTHNLNDVNMA